MFILFLYLFLDFYLSRIFFFFSSRRRHTRFDCDWSSDVCSSDLEVHGEELADRSVVVDDQDAVHRAHEEKVRKITFPPPGRSPIRDSPRCSRAIRATTASPSPLPRARCGVKGTKAFSRSSCWSVRPGSATETSHPCGSSRTATSMVPPPTSSAATAACRQRIFPAVRTRTGASAESA